MNMKDNISLNQYVNKLGKYLYNNLDGAFKLVKSSNTCDVYITLLYQLPKLQQIPGKGKDYNDVHEMIINLSITTYQDKIRINIIEQDEYERTLGHLIYHTDFLSDLKSAKSIIFKNVCKCISKHYSDYHFIY